MFELTPIQRSRIQVSMFQTLFRCRIDEFGVEQAFASAIVDSSDEVFEKALEKNPEKVQVWLDQHGPGNRPGKRKRR